MRTIIAAIVTCIALFAASLGTSQLLLKQDDDQVNEDDAIAEEPESEAAKPKVVMPVALRPENKVSIESVMQMSQSITAMEKDLNEREKRLAEKEQRVALLLDDLKTEQDELNALNKGVDVKLELFTGKLDELRTLLDQLDKRKAELEELEKSQSVDGDPEKNELEQRASDVKGWLEQMPPEQAADYLREISNSGKLEFAASLLQKMSDRQKSKILASLNDPVLLDQLIEAITIRRVN